MIYETRAKEAKGYAPNFAGHPGLDRPVPVSHGCIVRDRLGRQALSRPALRQCRSLRFLGAYTSPRGEMRPLVPTRPRPPSSPRDCAAVDLGDFGDRGLVKCLGDDLLYLVSVSLLLPH